MKNLFKTIYDSEMLWTKNSLTSKNQIPRPHIWMAEICIRYNDFPCHRPQKRSKYILFLWMCIPFCWLFALLSIEGLEFSPKAKDTAEKNRKKRKLDNQWQHFIAIMKFKSLKWIRTEHCVFLELHFRQLVWPREHLLTCSSIGIALQEKHLNCANGAELDDAIFIDCVCNYVFASKWRG